jgi:hypothetical protein
MAEEVEARSVCMTKGNLNSSKYYLVVLLHYWHYLILFQKDELFDLSVNYIDVIFVWRGKR